MTELIITTPYQLKQVVTDAVAEALQNQSKGNNEPREREAITSLEQLSQFLHCSKPTAQSIKKKVRTYQSGPRKFLIWTDELMEDLANTK
jgi:hypothetical protein